MTKVSPGRLCSLRMPGWLRSLTPPAIVVLDVLFLDADGSPRLALAVAKMRLCEHFVLKDETLAAEGGLLLAAAFTQSAPIRAKLHAWLDAG